MNILVTLSDENITVPRLLMSFSLPYHMKNKSIFQNILELIKNLKPPKNIQDFINGQGDTISIYIGLLLINLIIVLKGNSY